MAKKGPKPKPGHLKAISGTDQPCRRNDPAFAEPEGDASLPAQFETLRENRPTTAAVVLEVWNSLIDKYRRRGQPTAGYDRALYQLCLLEASIHEKTRLGIDVPAAQVNALRVWYSEFHDTPAGNVQPGGRVRENPFAKHGKRPPDSL